MTHGDKPSTQWRRDKDGLGVWEHRGKVAVAGYGHSPVDRRWDGVSMDKTLGAYSILACQKAMDDAGVTADQIDGVICCDSHIAGPSGGSASKWAPRPYFAPPYDSELGLTLVNARVAHQDRWGCERQVRAHRRAHDRRNGRHGRAGRGRWHVHHVPRDLSLRQPGRALPPRRRERRRLRARRPPVDGAVGQSRRQRLHQHLPAQPVLPEIRRHHDDLAPFVINQHKNGMLTPWGFNATHGIEPITVEDYKSSRYILNPLRIWDCDRPVQGVDRVSLHHRRSREGHAAAAGLRAEPFAAQLQAAQHAGGPGRDRGVDRPRGQADVRGRRARARRTSISSTRTTATPS